MLGYLYRQASDWLDSLTPRDTSLTSWERLTAIISKMSLSIPSLLHPFPS